MIRLLSGFALLVVALTAVAGAQVQPPLRSMGPATRGHGVTVNGAGAASLTASSARITLQISTADNRLSLTKESVAPIADALVKAGADPASVQLPLNFSAPGAANAASISALVRNPTVEMMKSGIITVGTAVAGLKDVRLMGAMVQLRATDCAAAQAQARQSAIANARAKAAAIAKELNIKLGDVVDVSANDQSSLSAGCDSQYYVGANGPQFNNPYGEDPPGGDAVYITIPVRSFVTITYAIK